MTAHARRQLSGVAFAAALIAGCASNAGDHSSAPSTSPVIEEAPTTTTNRGCGRGNVEARSVNTMRAGGIDRSYILEAPSNYDGETLLPLIINLHGFGSTAERQADYTRLGSVADAVVVTPDGVGSAQYWDLLASADNPDVAFLRDLVDQLADDYCVDTDRVYSTGISNGSAFSALLACLAPDLVAAVALVAATAGPMGCDPETTMPILVFHGTADPVAPYASGPSGTLTAPVEETVGIWAERNGCDPEPVEERIADDVARVTYGRCDADTTLYRVEGSGHVWPGAESTPEGEASLGPNTYSIDASALINEWFASHPGDR